jgi:hypothetical protein
MNPTQLYPDSKTFAGLSGKVVSRQSALGGNMSDESWDERFRQFLRKTGEDFRRAGDDVRAEAQRLVDAAMDPEKQQKVRDRLNELSDWARKTAQDMAGAMGEAASRAETAFQSASDKVAEASAKVRGKPARAARPKRKPAAAAKKKKGQTKARPAKKKSAGKRKR